MTKYTEFKNQFVELRGMVDRYFEGVSSAEWLAGYDMGVTLACRCFRVEFGGEDLGGLAEYMGRVVSARIETGRGMSEQSYRGVTDAFGDAVEIARHLM